MIKQTYFTQLNKIYSNTLTTIEFTILETLPKINFDKKKQIQTNKKIIEELERIIKNKNKVQIRGIINDKPKSTKKNQVLKIIKTLEKKTDNKNSSKPKDDNYDFIAATNSHEIINQIQLQTRNNTQFKTLKNQINRYLESNSPLNNKQVRLMNNTISKYKDKIQDSELRLKQFQIEKLSPIKKILDICQTKLNTLQEKKEAIENEISNKKQNNKFSIKEKLKSQIEVLEDKIEINTNRINGLKSHIDILKEKIKLGVEKEINPILFLLTLGLSYYRKSNTLKYKVAKQLIQISNLKEKNLKIELVKKERDIYYNRLDKNHQINLSQIESINFTINEIQSIQEKEELKFNNLKPKRNSIKKKLNLNIEKLKELDNEKINSQKTSLNKIENLIKKIENIFKNQKQEISEIKEKINNQITTINKELVIEI